MITIPQGGTIAGQAAQAGPAQISDTGSFVAQIGDAINTKFSAIKAKQDEIKTQRGTLDIVKDVGVEVQRFDQMTDPVQIEEEWKLVEPRLIEKYTNAKGPDGKPLHTPDQIAAYGLTIKDMTIRQGLRQGDRAIALTQSQEAAAWINDKIDIVNTAATADTDTMLAVLEIGQGRISKQRADGILTPEQEATQLAALEYDIYNARLISLGDQDPVGTLADLNAGEYDALGAERKAAAAVALQGIIDAQAAAEVKATEAAQAEQARVVSAKLKTMTDLYGKGVTVADEQLFDNPAFQASADYPAAVAARDLAREQPAIRQATVAQLDAAIAAEKADPKSETYQAERLTVLTKWRDEAAKGWTTDAVTQARKSGLTVPDLDVTDIETLPEAIAQRISNGGVLAKQGYIRDPRMGVLDEAERAALKAATAPEADYKSRAALAQAIAEGTGGNPEFLTGMIGADPVFAEAARLMVETGSATLATAMLRGQQKSTPGGTVVLPPKAALISVFTNITGGVYDDDPAAAAIGMAAVNALYADGARGIDPSNTEASTPFLDDDEAVAAYTAAVQQWSGSTPDRDGNLTVGGLQPIRDRMVKLPPGVPLEDVETALGNIENQLAGYSFDPDRQFWLPDADPDLAADGSSTAPADVMRGFKAASVDGRVPDFNGNADLVSSYQIEKVPGRNDQYRFVYPVDGRSQIVGDANGVEYRFRLPALIKGASR